MLSRGSVLPARTAPRKARRSVAVSLAALVGSASLLTGVAAPAQAAPKPIPAVTAHPVLQAGDRGPAVSWLQQALGLPATGYFNRTTVGRVKSLERKYGFPANGIMSRQEWNRLGAKRDPRAVAALAAKQRASRASRAATPGSAAFGQKVLSIAATYKGAPYRYGGNGPAYDCSGFVKSVFSKMGYSLPRTSAGMRAVTPRISNPVPGDLVFVHSSSGRVSHVGIYAGGGRWWEATRPGRALNLNKAWSSRVSYGRVR